MKHFLPRLALVMALLGLSLRTSAGQSLLYEVDYDDIAAYRSDGSSIQYPWAGGINSAQLGLAEVTGDGEQDLVVYDRYTGTLLVYQGTDSGFVWLPEGQAALSELVESWMRLVDMDGDGRNDLLTAHPFGIRVYANRMEDGQVVWEPLTTELGELFLQADSEVGLLNMQVNPAGLPAPADADGDGDVDLWVFNFATSLNINYFENTSMDSSGSPDALTFRRQSRYWGGLSDCGCGAVTLDSVGCRVEHAGGKSLWVGGVSNGMVNVLYGEEACVAPAWLGNEGTAKAPELVLADYTDSLPEWVDLAFPSPFMLNDSTLIFSSNLSEDEGKTIDFAHTLHRYQKIGAGWALQTVGWLQSDMVDVGTETTPAFADLDSDGDWDLLLAQEGGGPALQVWWNTGTAPEPAFTEGQAYTIEGDWADWRVYTVDLTGNGKREVILAGRDPAVAVYSFFYVEVNAEGALGTPQEWAFPLVNGQEVTFADLDEDGILDALVGEASGRIRRYVAVGSPLAPEWEERDAAFLGLENSLERLEARPALGDLDGDGRLDLLISSPRSSPVWLSDVRWGGVQEPVPLLSATGGLLDLPGWNAAAILPHNLDEPALLAVGTQGGGLQWLHSVSEVMPPNSPTWKVYPNPSAGVFVLRSAASASAVVYSVTGQRIWGGEIPAQEPISVDLSGLATGMYMVQMRFATGQVEARLLYIVP